MIRGLIFVVPTHGNSSVVMPLALKDLNRIFSRCDCTDSKYYAVFLIDAYTPPSAEITSKRFGVAYTSSPIAIDTLKEQVNALERLDILQLPSKIFLPSVFVPDFTHEQSPRHRVIRVRRYFGAHPFRGRGVRVRECCLQSRRGLLIPQRVVSHVGGIAV